MVCKHTDQCLSCDAWCLAEEASVVAHDAVNRWTDNIELLRGWCKKRFEGMEQPLQELFEQVQRIVSNPAMADTGQALHPFAAAMSMPCVRWGLPCIYLD